MLLNFFGWWAGTLVPKTAKYPILWCDMPLWTWATARSWIYPGFALVRTTTRVESWQLNAALTGKKTHLFSVVFDAVIVFNGLCCKWSLLQRQRKRYLSPSGRCDLAVKAKESFVNDNKKTAPDERDVLVSWLMRMNEAKKEDGDRGPAWALICPSSIRSMTYEIFFEKKLRKDAATSHVHFSTNRVLKILSRGHHLRAPSPRTVRKNADVCVLDIFSHGFVFSHDW